MGEAPTTTATTTTTTTTMTLVHLANEAYFIANDLARITTSIYGMDDVAIRRDLDRLRDVARSLRDVAAGKEVAP
jgi:hypothetical protein